MYASCNQLLFDSVGTLLREFETGSIVATINMAYYFDSHILVAHKEVGKMVNLVSGTGFEGGSVIVEKKSFKNKWLAFVGKM